jgi:F420H(2)-dependent quinone reductase
MADGRIRNCKFLALLLKHFAGAHIWVYRRTNGRLGAKLLWLPAARVTTRRHKTGEPRTTPTLYLRDGDRRRAARLVRWPRQQSLSGAHTDSR